METWVSCKINSTYIEKGFSPLVIFLKLNIFNATIVGTIMMITSVYQIYG